MMDETFPTFQSVVKVELEFKEEPDEDKEPSGSEGHENCHGDDSSAFELPLMKNEEEEEIEATPPATIFLQSSLEDEDNVVQENEEVKPPATIFLQPSFEDDNNVVQENDPLSLGDDSSEETLSDSGFTCELMTTEDGDTECLEGAQSRRLPSSEGAENMIIPDDQQSTGRSTRVNESGTTSICSISTKSLNSSFQLQDPQLPESEVLICLKCHKAFSTSTDLKKHMRFDECSRIHKCTYCCYSAQSSTKLTIHLRTHTREQPYKCPYCVFRCKWIGDLAVHIKIHLDRKPYQCPECDFKAVSPSGLKRHQHIHSGEKPYQCSECDFKSSEPSNLTRHQRKHQRKKPY